MSSQQSLGATGIHEGRSWIRCDGAGYGIGIGRRDTSQIRMMPRRVTEDESQAHWKVVGTDRHSGSQLHGDTLTRRWESFCSRCSVTAGRDVCSRISRENFPEVSTENYISVLQRRSVQQTQIRRRGGESEGAETVRPLLYKGRLLGLGICALFRYDQ